jgi:DNA polymerase (family 10)
VPVHNADIARVFAEIADLLEIEDANPFRVRAYRRAARNLEECAIDVAQALARGEALPRLPGIGADLAAKIAEIVATGTCGLRERLRAELPPAIGDLLGIPGLGPKRVRALHRDLGIETVEQLARAARDARVRALHGFGEKTEAAILRAVAARSAAGSRVKLATAAQYAASLVRHLAGARGVGVIEVAGSFRRMRETVGDLDVVVSASDAGAVGKRLLVYDEIAQVLATGPTRTSVRLKSGLQVDVRIVAPASFGAALQYFTGSKAHNIALRRRAQARGLKLNEYGLFRGARVVAGRTEEEIYAALGLPWIAPELREDRGEIEAAEGGRLPRLVALEDLRGDLHAHTTATDGQHTLAQMADAARARGLEYLAITEHSQRLRMAHGLDAKRLAEQGREIDRLNRAVRGLTLLKGIEVDILEDGRLDLPDSALAGLDLVVAAVHSRFDLPAAAQTDRVLRALDDPHVRILAHPTGRLVAEREPYDIDLPRVLRKAAARGVALEVNAHPSRLDLTDTHCRMARDAGVLVAISSDAHSTFEFDNLRFGIGQARRGWLEPANVLNTRRLDELRRFLAR